MIPGGAQRIDKIIFGKKAKTLRYVIGNKVYKYNIYPIAEFDKAEIFDNTNIINIVDINDTYSMVTPSPYSMDRIGMKGVGGITIIKNGDDDLMYRLDSSTSSILRAVVDGNNIFIVTENSILRTDLDLQHIETIGTFSNSGGILSINKGDTPTKVMVTISSTKGSILVYKYSTKSELGSREMLEINAHRNNIKAIAISRDGSKVATASECGTNINVYSTDTGSLFKTFKRGVWSKDIRNLSFNWNGTVLACISSSGSIHFFDMYAEDKNRKSVILGFMSSFIPESVSNMEWSAFPICLNIGPNTRMECEFSKNGVYHIVTYDGYYYKIPPTHTTISDAHLLELN